MTSRDVSEVIHEALVMYIDDKSTIDSVRMLPDSKVPSNPEGLMVKLRDGEKFQLLVIQSFDD